MTWLVKAAELGAEVTHAYLGGGEGARPWRVATQCQSSRRERAECTVDHFNNIISVSLFKLYP